MASKLSSLLNGKKEKNKVLALSMNHHHNQNTTNSSTANNTVSGGGETDVYVRADGKIVRRIRKNVARTPSNDTLATTESEIYIRADGKKVRRVRKANSTIAAAATALPSTTTLLEAATNDATNTTTAEDVGEVFINKDGKKVRRVKRTKSNVGGTASESDTASATSKTSLGGFLMTGAEQNNPNVQVYINEQGKKVRRILKPKGSAATVSGGSVGGEIYIRPDGKKVRRVVIQRNVSTASIPVEQQLQQQPSTAPTTTSLPAEGEVFINKDGKKVRRVKKTTSSASLAQIQSTPKRRVIRSASASISGSSDAEGEIYIRADGKKVRRIRKQPSTPQPPAMANNTSSTKNNALSTSDDASKTMNGTNHNLSSYLDSKPAAKPTTGAATVAGDRKLDGEIIIRPDGKKVIRRVKKSHEDNGMEGEVYRRADGKLVRRVKRSSSAKEASMTTTSTGNTTTPLLKQSLDTPENASTPETSSLILDQKQKDPIKTSSSSLVPILSESEEATALQYRKMKKMGLPDDAVRHKMTVSNVNSKIQAAVLDEEYTEPPPATTTMVEPTKEDDSLVLSTEQQNIANLYRNMMQMGLPESSVRHKMVVSEVHPKVIAAVFGESMEKSPKPAAPTSKVVQPQRLEKVPEVDVAETEVTNVNLSADEQERVNQFRKMLRMGLPLDAVRHKMVVAEVDQKIMDIVLGRSSSTNDNVGMEPGADESNTTRPLTPEEDALAEPYRKMIRLGMAQDAVRHKMIINEVDPIIITAVLNIDTNNSGANDKSNQDIAKSSNEATSSGAPNAVAFVVIVGDQSADQSAKHAMANGGSDNVIDLNPEEKFEVKVKEKSTPETEGQQVTKFFTLDELAKLSGQNKNELQAIVAEKRKRGASPPRFSLLPLDEQKFEVSVPQKPAPGSNTTAAAVGESRASNMKKEVGDGQEVVDSALAQAARAVTALGDGDMTALLEKLKAGDMKDLLAKLHEAEKRQKKLEKQLAQSGIAIAEDIEYSEAKDKVEEIAKRMNEIGGSDVTVADKQEQNRLREEYFKLEQEMERYNTALMLTEEYQAEQDRVERKWEDDNEPENIKALKKLRRHMPVNIRHLSEADLTTRPSPNGKYLPKAIAKKFKRTNVLQCLRLNPDDIECMHPATLENMRVTGLTLTERRALYAHLRPIGPKWKKNKAEKMTERKWTWYQMMKSNFKEAVAPYQRHIDQYGPPENHKCPLIGKQCPIRADKEFDYDGDYGWTSGDEYEVSEVRKADVEDSGAKAMAEARELAKEKKANERADILKKHYNGKLLQVSKANGSCESMDESMDNMENNIMRWIEFIADKGPDDKKEPAAFTDAANEFKLKLLDYAQRSGMQMSGKKKVGGDTIDIRSIVEVSLAEEVYECSKEFFKFIRDRLEELKSHDTRITKTIEMLEGILEELHQRNLNVIKTLGLKRLDRSRKLRSIADLKKQVEDRRKPEVEPEAPVAAVSGPPIGAPGRGGLMDALAGRGRGGGRGGLMDAIAGRGRGGRGGDKDAGGGGGGRGGLMDAIAGRGRGGGRGGLMDAIAARGQGRGPPGGGRGGLMAAIAARGGGGGDT